MGRPMAALHHLPMAALHHLPMGLLGCRVTPLRLDFAWSHGSRDGRTFAFILFGPARTQSHVWPNVSLGSCVWLRCGGGNQLRCLDAALHHLPMGLLGCRVTPLRLDFAWSHGSRDGRMFAFILFGPARTKSHVWPNVSFGSCVWLGSGGGEPTTMSGGCTSASDGNGACTSSSANGLNASANGSANGPANVLNTSGNGCTSSSANGAARLRFIICQWWRGEPTAAMSGGCTSSASANGTLNSALACPYISSRSANGTLNSALPCRVGRSPPENHLVLELCARVRALSTLAPLALLELAPAAIGNIAALAPIAAALKLAPLALLELPLAAPQTTS
jgi:hypothetical protein